MNKIFRLKKITLLGLLTFSLSFAQIKYNPASVYLWDPDKYKVKNHPVKGSVEIDTLNQKVNVKLSKFSQIYKFTDVQQIISTNGQVVWNDEISGLKEKKCNLNKNFSVAVIDFMNDKYALTEEITSTYNEECYNVVDQYEVLKYLAENKINKNELDLYKLVEIGEGIGADFVVHGQTYLINVPLKYTSSTMTPSITSYYNTNLNSFLNNLPSMIDAGMENIARSQAVLAAGNYVKLTLYSVNVEDKKKKILYDNKAVLKLD